jgi:hypothetical protein
MAITDAGESKAWGLLAASDPAVVCARAGVGYDAFSGAYLLPSFGQQFSVEPGRRQILSLQPDGEVFLKRHASFFRLSVLWYLVRASPANTSGNLVKPASLPGGEIFFKGSHVLPLEALAEKYATRPEAFLAAGLALGGQAAAHGDAAVVLMPLPKIPTTVILWTEDDEFPARADLLFDATGPQHLPLDILWSVAMLSVLPLL